MSTKRFISNTPRCEIVIATEMVVRELLSLNTGNRRVRQGHIDYLAEQILRDNYVLTNQGVGVDVNGVLIDGQHRLQAIVKAEFPNVQLLVVYGLPPSARVAVDIGVNRTMSDIMRFAFDRPEASSLMMATVRAWGLCTIYGGKPPPSKRIPPEQMFDWYQTLSPAMESVLNQAGSNRLAAPVLAALCHRIHRQPHDSERVMLFLDQLVSGAGLEKDSPVLRLRNWLQTNKGASGGELSRDRFQRTATALIAFLEGRTLDKLYARKNVATELSRQLLQTETK